MGKKGFLMVGAGVVAIGLLVAGLSGAFFQSSGSRFMANITGAEEVPPVTTAAMGSATFMVSADGMSMTFTLNVSNMNNITASHIHLAAAGVNGPVVVPLFVVPGGKPGMFTGVLAEGTITAANLGGLLAGKPLSALVAEMNAGNTYVNVHTQANPGGEIRGQIRMAP